MWNKSSSFEPSSRALVSGKKRPSGASLEEVGSVVVDPEQPEDLDGGDLKVALLAKRRVVEGQTLLRLAGGQVRVDEDPVAFTERLGNFFYPFAKHRNDFLRYASKDA